MKNPSLSTLKKKLWRIFSEYIRKKYSDENGMTPCITCGVIKRWQELHAGHYVAKSLGLSVYFCEKNVHPQCAGCNTFRHGNLSVYALALQNTYGAGILRELEAIKNTPVKYSKSDYEEMIFKYSKELRELKENV